MDDLFVEGSSRKAGVDSPVAPDAYLHDAGLEYWLTASPEGGGDSVPTLYKDSASLLCACRLGGVHACTLSRAVVYMQTRSCVLHAYSVSLLIGCESSTASSSGPSRIQVSSRGSSFAYIHR